MWNDLKTRAEFIIKTIQKEFKILKKRKYVKRKLVQTENENKSKQKRLESNSIATSHETSGDMRLPTNILKEQ